MKLYGKTALKRRLDDIFAKGRMPHAVMFSGRAGSGRKTLAKYLAELFLCGSSACGECAVCRNIERGTHPDVIFVKEQCGGKYAMEPFREVLNGTVTRPNNGDLKIYIFEDCGEMRAEHQNSLLKLIEEPADYLRFIFTCESTGVIPETVLSRVAEFEVPDTPIADCEQALLDFGVERSKARELSEMFAGNIGKCLEVNGGGGDAQLIETARKAAAALGRRDGFGLNAALSEQTGRAEFSRVVEYLSGIVRDALAVKCGGEAEYFAKNESLTIAAAFSETELLRILDAAFELAENERLNLNLALTAAYFTSKALPEL